MLEGTDDGQGSRMTQQQAPVTARTRARSLRGLCGGAVHLPGDPAYDMARAPWNLQACDHPAAVVYPAFPEEVAEQLFLAPGTVHAVLQGSDGDRLKFLSSGPTDAVRH